MMSSSGNRTTMTRINRDTLAALKELRWKYRAETVSDVIDCLLYVAEPELFREYISEDEPEIEN